MSPIGFTLGSHPKGHWPDGHFPIYHWPGTPTEDKMPSDDLQHSPCFIVGSYLIANGVVSLPSLSSDWPLYKSAMPDVADNYGAIYDTAPIIDTRVSESFPNTHYPHWKIKQV